MFHKRIGDSVGRAQSAIELLITYSWALLIIIIVIGIAFGLSFSAPSASYLPSVCYIQPLLPCVDSALLAAAGSAPIKYYMEFTNNLRIPIYFPTNALNLTLTNIGSSGTSAYTGNCIPRLAQPGVQVSCIVNVPGSVQPPLGSRVNSLFNIAYQICSGSNTSTCSSSVYKASGYATQSFGAGTLSPYYVLVETQLWSNSITNVGPAGYLLISGLQYSNSSNVIFQLPGNYIIYSNPPAGGSFVSYNIIGGASEFTPGPTSNVAPANMTANLFLTSNSIIVAKFTTARCGVCVSPVGTPVCPAQCPSCYSVVCTTTSTSTTTSTGSTTSTTTTTTTTTIDYIFSHTNCNNGSPCSITLSSGTLPNLCGAATYAPISSVNWTAVAGTTYASTGYLPAGQNTCTVSYASTVATVAILEPLVSGFFTGPSGTPSTSPFTITWTTSISDHSFVIISTSDTSIPSIKLSTGCSIIGYEVNTLPPYYPAVYLIECIDSAQYTITVSASGAEAGYQAWGVYEVP